MRKFKTSLSHTKESKSMTTTTKRKIIYKLGAGL